MYIGNFQMEKMIEAAKVYIRLHVNKITHSEYEVAFTSRDGKDSGYLQFVLLDGQWVYVNVRTDNVRTENKQIEPSNNLL